MEAGGLSAIALTTTRATRRPRGRMALCTSRCQTTQSSRTLAKMVLAFGRTDYLAKLELGMKLEDETARWSDFNTVRFDCAETAREVIVRKTLRNGLLYDASLLFTTKDRMSRTSTRGSVYHVQTGEVFTPGSMSNMHYLEIGHGRFHPAVQVAAMPSRPSFRSAEHPGSCINKAESQSQQAK